MKVFEWTSLINSLLLPWYPQAGRRLMLPSRSALLSGRLPMHVNQAQPQSALALGGVDVRMETVADRLRSVGYRTALVGKWHVGMRTAAQLPSRRGFERVLAYLKVVNPRRRRRTGVIGS